MGLNLRFRRRMMTSLVLTFLILVSPGLATAQERRTGESLGWQGTGSCAATACHGGRREPLALKGSEYGFSQAYDPHSRAYSVLFDERSLLIERNLQKLYSTTLAKPYEDNTCLRCHVLQGFTLEAKWTRSPEFAIADGVSCEGCHGAAGNWLVAHTEAGFRGLSEREKFEGFGMRPTKDLLARGQACVECHVGVGSTDVNHDLIAAGHPRLNFEYGSQLAKLPKHWKVEEDKARNPDYEAKVFVLGQLLTAKASLDLLESRAVRSIPEDSNSPWPELAEYSCFSCHHELVKNGWAAANATLSSSRGTLQWGTWSLPLVQILPPEMKELEAESRFSTFGSLRLLMTASAPDPSTVASRAHQASEVLGRMASSVNEGKISPGEVRTMLARSLQPDNAHPLDWDSAARRYLAIVALDKAAAESDPRYSDRPVVAGLEKLFQSLDLAGQVAGGGKIFDSPRRYDPKLVFDRFQSVQAALPNP